MAALITTTEIGAPAVGTDKPAYLLYQQIRLQLQRDLGNDIAQYLAEPVFDGNQDEIDWYSTVDGPITPFNLLSDEDKIEYIGQVESIRQQLNRVGNHYLKDESDPAKITIGKALIAASGQPEDQYRYLVGEHPVVVFWGFIQKATDYPELLEKFIEIHHPPEPEPPEEPETPQEAETPTQQEDSHPVDQPAVTPPAPAPQQPSRPPEISPFTLPPEEFNLLKFAGKVLWGSVLFAILLLLILLMLKVLGVIGNNTGAPVFPTGSDTNQTEQIDQVKQANTTGEALQKELAGLQSKLAEKLCDCKPGPEAAKEEKAKPEEEPTPPPEPEIEEVVESCDIRNLSGRWQSRSNELRNAQSGDPVIVNYDFNVNGRGTIGITQVDNSRCKGRATAQFKKTNEECILHVKATTASCPTTRSSYNSHEVECQLGEDGQAKCTLIQKGAKPIYAEFDRRSVQG